LGLVEDLDMLQLAGVIDRERESGQRATYKEPMAKVLSRPLMRFRLKVFI